jgi:hypothetical protein
MTTKERILERLAFLIEAAEKHFVELRRNTPEESLVLGRAAAYSTAFAIVTEEFAKEE